MPDLARRAAYDAARSQVIALIERFEYGDHDVDNRLEPGIGFGSQASFESRLAETLR